MQIKIESLSYGGRGVGKLDGKTFFVGNTVPGDVVEIRVIKDKKSFAEAEIVKITEPSPDRVTPVCEYFERCGGCQWQNVEYKTQLRQKENILRDSLKRIGELKNINIESIEPSEKPYGYRNRVVLNVWDEDGEKKIGYFGENSTKKASIKHCPVADEKVNQSIKNAIGLIKNAVFKKNNAGKLTIASGLENASIKTRNISSEIRETNEFAFKMLGIELVSSPEVFNQANYYINEKIAEYILNFAAAVSPQKALDLYCGFGNFSIPLAAYAKKVLGVDLDKRAVRLAKRNAKHNQIKNVRFINQKVEKFLKTLHENEYDLVLLDPPRSGAKAAIKTISLLKPSYVVYISCNPATLARDIKVLSSAGYRVERVKPFDMFPQTYHIETVVILSYDKT